VEWDYFPSSKRTCGQKAGNSSFATTRRSTVPAFFFFGGSRFANYLPLYELLAVGLTAFLLYGFSRKYMERVFP